MEWMFKLIESDNEFISHCKMSLLFMVVGSISAFVMMIAFMYLLSFFLPITGVNLLGASIGTALGCGIMGAIAPFVFWITKG